MKTTITCSPEHGFKKGDLITITKSRRSKVSKIIAIMVGAFCFYWLNRSYSDFVNYENIRAEVTSEPSLTTFTIEQ